ncbi:MAG: CopG family antitoxin [Desulfotomaculales bacterium]
MPKKLPEFKGDEIPEFATEKEAAEFFDRYSFAEAMEKCLFEPEEVELDPELAAKIRERAQTKRVTLRLRVSQIEAAKEIARKKDIPYQTLIRFWVAEAIRREQEGRA